MINERITAYIDKQGMIILTSMMHNKLNGEGVQRKFLHDVLFTKSWYGYTYAYVDDVNDMIIPM